MRMLAAAARPAASESEALLGYLDEACADDAELRATAAALADAGELELLRLMRDFRDDVSGAELLQRYGPEAALEERLRVIHRVYVDCARRVREESDRPVRARHCYEARMLARRDNYQAMLEEAGGSLAAEERAACEALVGCARDKAAYEELPARLGRDARAVEELILRLRQRFKEWAARVRYGRTVPPLEGSAMGDTSSGAGAASSFTAGQLFDPRSAYGRMRGSLEPEAKLRGFFHHLAVTQKAKRGEARARAFAADTSPRALLLPLVTSAARPERALDAELWVDLVPFGGRARLLVGFRLRDRADAPAEGTACRALLLTPGMLERLCGAETVRSSEGARRALGAVLSGGAGDPFEAARVLAAVPDLDGEMEEGGFCKFRPFDLPEQAAHVAELPSKTVVLVVLAG